MAKEAQATAGSTPRVECRNPHKLRGTAGSTPRVECRNPHIARHSWFHSPCRVSQFRTNYESLAVPPPKDKKPGKKPTMRALFFALATATSALRLTTTPPRASVRMGLSKGAQFPAAALEKFGVAGEKAVLFFFGAAFWKKCGV